MNNHNRQLTAKHQRLQQVMLQLLLQVRAVRHLSVRLQQIAKARLQKTVNRHQQTVKVRHQKTVNQHQQIVRVRLQRIAKVHRLIAKVKALLRRVRQKARVRAIPHQQAVSLVANQQTLLQRVRHRLQHHCQPLIARVKAQHRYHYVH
ncbi:hypothetical protein [Staphylococcus chromogenes]|nr:hypothetical protein [Staphylococcus chromogenes]